VNRLECSRRRGATALKASSAFWCLVLAAICATAPVHADEGGASFWLPGQMGSFAASPAEPGWSLPVILYHSSVEAGAQKTFQRGGRIVGGLDVRANLLFVIPTYTFKEQLLGAQAALSVTTAVGRMDASVNGTLTGPLGGFSVSGAASDNVGGIGDLFPMGSLKWNYGVHNLMAYVMGGIPVGAYKAGRLANLGINHYALDAGGGYTYLDPKKGHELSAVLGFTKNFENKDTSYTNGTSAHLDWAASQFFSEQVHAGLAGYFYNQLSGDSGAGATLGDHKSRVNGIGPQVGYFFPVGGRQWYVNAKAIAEWGAQNRAEGWNFWLTVAIPFGEGK
jgi:hypothetical protein